MTYDERDQTAHQLECLLVAEEHFCPSHQPHPALQGEEGISREALRPWLPDRRLPCLDECASTRAYPDKGQCVASRVQVRLYLQTPCKSPARRQKEDGTELTEEQDITRGGTVRLVTGRGRTHCPVEVFKAAHHKRSSAPDTAAFSQVVRCCICHTCGEVHKILSPWQL